MPKIHLMVVSFVLPVVFCCIRPGWSRQEEPGYVLVRETDVAKKAPGPHDGKGISTGYVFFDNVPGFKISFRKRVLHPGASIGYHKHIIHQILV